MRKLAAFIAFFLLCGVGAALAAAEEVQGAAGSEVSGWTTKSAIALASGFAIGVAALGGALGQSRAISSGLEGIARNPEASGRIFTPLIIGLALIESLVIYALVISFLLQLKL